MDIPAIDVSLVDARPQELLLLSVDGLSVELVQGNSAGTPFDLIALRVNYAQVGGG